MTRYTSGKQSQNQSTTSFKKGSQAKRPSAKAHPATILQRAIADPSSVSRDELLQAQSAYGNRVMRKVIGSGSHQKMIPGARSPKPMVQRFVTGTHSYLSGVGGKTTWHKSSYKTMLSKLKKYENAEGKGTSKSSDLNEIYDSASSWLDDSSHISSMESENSKSVGRARGLGYLMGVIAREQGRFGSDILNRQSRTRIHLYMGQGIVGHLGQLILSSNEFSTCSPIVMFNNQTGIGGLYHFPASALYSLDSGTSHMAYMLAMAEAVEPTHIIVHSGADRNISESGNYDGDDMFSKMMSGRTDNQNGWEENRDELMSMFRGVFTGGINISEGQGTSEIAITLGNRSNGVYSLKQSSSLSGRSTHDMAQNPIPPSNAIRFGRMHAGHDWMKDIHGKVFYDKSKY